MLTEDQIFKYKVSLNFLIFVGASILRKKISPKIYQIYQNYTKKKIFLTDIPLKFINKSFKITELRPRNRINFGKLL